VLLPAGAVAAGNTRVVVEIGAKAEQQVDPLFTRRLLQLELSDVEVPPAPSAERLSWTALFYRVLATEPEKLRVELWERGEFHGARTVNVTRGSAQLHARRIALAAAELARGLRQKRLARAALPEKPNGDGAVLEPGTGARLLLDSGLRAAALNGGDTLLAGPELAALVRFDVGLDLELSTAWLFGEVRELSGPVRAVWREVRLSPAFMGGVSPGVRLGVGGNFAAAAVHVGGARRIEDEAGSDTWSGRTTLDGRLELALGRSAALSFRPEVGATLRRLRIVDERDGRERLGGLWLGASLHVLLGGSVWPRP
jgi:hypothetical protein